jgi:hypothetical protein
VFHAGKLKPEAMASKVKIQAASRAWLAHRNRRRAALRAAAASLVQHALNNPGIARLQNPLQSEKRVSS